MEQHEVETGWRLCWAEPRNRSSKDPGSSLLEKFEDLAAREEAVGYPFGVSRSFLAQVDCLTSMSWSSSAQRRSMHWPRIAAFPTPWIFGYF